MGDVLTSGYEATGTEKDGLNSSGILGNTTSSIELMLSSEELQSSKDYKNDSPPSVSPDSMRESTTAATSTSNILATKNQNKKNGITSQQEKHVDVVDVGEYSFSKHATFKGRKVYRMDKHKARKSGNCDRVTDILALTNYLQVKIIESLLYESISWPRGERSHFRGMVNHMRRELQAMDAEKEQLKVIRSHLLRYMGSDKDRQNLVLPLTIGEWGTVLQLLECLQKKL